MLGGDLIQDRRFRIARPVRGVDSHEGATFWIAEFSRGVSCGFTVRTADRLSREECFQLLSYLGNLTLHQRQNSAMGICEQALVTVPKPATFRILGGAIVKRLAGYLVMGRKQTLKIDMS